MKKKIRNRILVRSLRQKQNSDPDWIVKDKLRFWHALSIGYKSAPAVVYLHTVTIESHLVYVVNDGYLCTINISLLKS